MRESASIRPKSRRGRTLAIAVAALIAFGTTAVVGAQLFERIAPFGARMTKFAVQRPYGVAASVGVAIVVLYVAIALLAYFQGRVSSQPTNRNPTTSPDGGHA